MATEPSSREEKSGQDRKGTGQDQDFKSDKGGSVGEEAKNLPEETEWKRGSGLLGRKH